MLLNFYFINKWKHAFNPDCQFMTIMNDKEYYSVLKLAKFLQTAFELRGNLLSEGQTL